MKTHTMHLDIARLTVAAAALAATVAVGDEPPGLKLPEDLQAGADNRGLQYHEQHIGGRLERVTITRDNGFTETYRNKRADTIWRAPANEIGETANTRQWIIWAR